MQEGVYNQSELNSLVRRGVCARHRPLPRNVERRQGVDQVDDAIHILEALRSPDQAEVFSELDDEDQENLLPRLNVSDSAVILEELDEEEAARLASNLPQETVARILDEMQPDEAADLLEDLPDHQAQALLARLEDPEEIRPLLFHPDDSAGGLMTSEFLALRPKMTAREVIVALRQWKPESETIY